MPSPHNTVHDQYRLTLKSFGPVSYGGMEAALPIMGPGEPKGNDAALKCSFSSVGMHHKCTPGISSPLDPGLPQTLVLGVLNP